MGFGCFTGQVFNRERMKNEPIIWKVKTKGIEGYCPEGWLTYWVHEGLDGLECVIWSETRKSGSPEIARFRVKKT